MKVYWWQGGLFIRPEDKQEDEALTLLVEKLELVRVNHEIATGPIAKFSNENPVVVVHKLS